MEIWEYFEVKWDAGGMNTDTKQFEQFLKMKNSVNKYLSIVTSAFKNAKNGAVCMFLTRYALYVQF